MTYDNRSLAEALAISVRTVERLKAAGLDGPREGEGLDAWVARATEFRASRRRRPGPSPAGGDGDIDQANLRFRLARAELVEIQVRRARDELHDKAACEVEFVARCGEIRAAFVQVPARLARRLYQAPSPEAIQAAVEDELRRCFAILVGDEPAPADDEASGD